MNKDTKNVVRANHRAHDHIRPVSLTYSAFGYAPGSVLFSIGNTKVLCSITMQPQVPSFLKGTKTGWVTAEYAMLPTATHVRTQRESSAVKKNGRSVEISRMIGRALRAVVDLSILGERTIVVDCDVLQADGSTRTACITAASYALHAAQEHWLRKKLITAPLIQEKVVAISVGIKNSVVLLDLDYKEDSDIDADFNIVLTESGSLVEIQGAGEKKAIAWEQFESIQRCAQDGVRQLLAACNVSVRAPANQCQQQSLKERKGAHQPLFSLKNRV